MQHGNAANGIDYKRADIASAGTYMGSRGYDADPTSPGVAATMSTSQCLHLWRFHPPVATIHLRSLLSRG